MPFLSVTKVIYAALAFLVLTFSAAAQNVEHLRKVNRPCHAPAISTLQRLSPNGFAIYAAYRDKGDFKSWISDCDDVIGGLTTAVHETVHMLSAELNAYPLVGGGSIPRIPESPVFFAPAELASRFPSSSAFVESYLTRGAASSADYLRYLFDEFNAYAHDLDTATRLKHLEASNMITAHRDGLAAFMAFISAYAVKAKLDYPKTWQALHRPQVRQTLYTLWAQAEDVMGNSCHLRGIAEEAYGYLSRVCRANIKHPLASLLGRPPLCPVSCLRR